MGSLRPTNHDAVVVIIHGGLESNPCNCIDGSMGRHMNETEDLVSALLAIAIAAVMLVTGDCTSIGQFNLLLVPFRSPWLTIISKQLHETMNEPMGWGSHQAGLLLLLPDS